MVGRWEHNRFCINFTDTFNNGFNVIEEYVLTLIGTTQYGCTSSDTDTVTVYPDPIAIIDTNGNILDCATLVIDSTLIQADTLNTIANHNYEWIITHYNPSVYTITGNGYYPPLDSITSDNDSVQVQLIVTNAWNCNPDTATIMIYTIEDPIADFIISDSTGCSPLIIQTDTTINSTNGIYTWEVWNLNTGNIDTTIITTGISTPIITLNNYSNLVDSIYVIQLTVGDTNGCYHSTHDTVIVHPNPEAYFTTNTNAICPDEIITVNDSSTTSIALNYTWTIDPSADIDDANADTTTITFPNNTIGYDSIYNITLNIIDTNGCVDSYIDSIAIHTNPIALFSITPDACGPDTLTPTNNSSFQDSCLWTVSSPTVGISDSTDCNPEFYFPENTGQIDSTYIITLTVTTSNGCDSTITDTVIIHPTPFVEINPTLLDSCGPFIIDFINNSDPYNSNSISTMNFEWWVDGNIIDSSINYTDTFNNGFNVMKNMYLH